MGSDRNAEREPKTAEDLQTGQDASAAETRRNEEEGPETTPSSRTDLAQDEEGNTAPGDG